jgi:hypothetical protein
MIARGAAAGRHTHMVVTITEPELRAEEENGTDDDALEPAGRGVGRLAPGGDRPPARSSGGIDRLLVAVRPAPAADAMTGTPR